VEIVYCGGCGKVLRGDDFTRGHAVMLDHRPWCAECKPPDKTPILSAAPSAEARRSGSSAKHPRIVVGTGRHEAVRPASNKTLYLGIGAAGAAFLVIALALGSSSRPPATERAGKPPVEQPRRAPESAEAERVLRDLEQFASLAPPEKILARCEEQAGKVRGTPQEQRFREIEAAARTQQKQRGQETQLTKELDALRKMIDEDPRFARSDEIVKRLKAAREIAGGRAPELDRRLADYQRSRQESPHEKREGPFFEDAEGFLRNWLVLGVFPNDKDKGLDVDFLKTETAADPVTGQAVGKLKWAAYASPEAKIDFFLVGHLNIKPPKDYVIAYAYCVVQVPEQIAAEVRLGSDDGQMLWIDGTLVGKLHKPRALKIDEDRYAVPLSPGLHRILLKVDQHSKAYEFAMRILSADGRALPALKIWN
jgi:hypothetical protein